MEIFTRAKSVCFRDSYSYGLFDKLDNVSYAPDVVFSLNYQPKESDKKVVYSIIDLGSRKGLSQYKEQYEKMIIDSIKHYQKEDYEIVLMSFCTKEGDMNAINSIINKLDNTNNISIYEYDGNMNEALDVLATSEIIYASRFHATILGLLFKKKLLPIVYSDKTLNVLSDMNYSNQLVDIRKLETYNINYESIKRPIVNIDELKLKSNEQFKDLDKILN
jgi:colanic acid/amylovoran biosynthesis protein